MPLAFLLPRTFSQGNRRDGFRVRRVGRSTASLWRPLPVRNSGMVTTGPARSHCAMAELELGRQQRRRQRRFTRLVSALAKSPGSSSISRPPGSTSGAITG